MTLPSHISGAARVAAALALAVLACRPAGRAALPVPRDAEHRMVPAPVSLRLTGGEAFVITDSTRIVVGDAEAEVMRTAELFAAIVRPSTGFAIPVAAASRSAGAVVLRLASDRAALGEEGYELNVSRDSVRITAYRPAGLFRGTQTLRQLLPADIESHMKLSGVPWTIPAVQITDQPRFAWRGAMLDVARHFFTVREVKQYIDILALYKLNVLHLHLADDQGWRIEIPSRPKLVAEGSVTQVGGGPGGYYTQAEYSDLVRYAQERYITIVPEIDMPGHTNAALVAYPELSCSRRPPALYTGTDVGFSALCPDKEETYALIDDIIRDLSRVTPGPYFHVGGDEVEVLSDSVYARFIERVQTIVAKHGKRMVGWEEIAKANLSPTTLAQQWKTDSAALALRHQAKLILSPGKRMYLDMKYDANTELGLTWAGLVEVRTVYDWDPGTSIAGVSERDIMGVEAPLWAETIRNITAAQYLAMPRLPAVAELGWTPQAQRDWEGFRVRLAHHARRWRFLGINYYRSPQIPW